MTNQEWKQLWQKMRRRWLKPNEWPDFDDMADAIFEDLQSWPFETVKSCMIYLEKTFKPRYREEMPGLARFEEAKEALFGSTPSTDSIQDDDWPDKDYVAEIEKRIDSLPQDERAALRVRATAWAEQYLAEIVWKISYARKAAWRISEANVFCQENGLRVPKSYVASKPLEQREFKPLLKTMPTGEKHEIDESKREKIKAQIKRATRTS